VIIFNTDPIAKMFRLAAKQSSRALTAPLSKSLGAAEALSTSWRPVAAMPNVSSRISAVRHYHDKVLDHYSRPRNPGSMDKSDPAVGTGLVGAPACGDVMKLQIKVDGGKIVDAKFKTFGCGSAIASSSYLTELVKGMRLEDAAKIRNVDISRELSLPPVKLHCSMLAEDAIKAAIKDYNSKNAAIATDLGGTSQTFAKEA